MRGFETVERAGDDGLTILLGTIRRVGGHWELCVEGNSVGELAVGMTGLGEAGILV
jgi:hypothetical protein